MKLGNQRVAFHCSNIYNSFRNRINERQFSIPALMNLATNCSVNNDGNKPRISPVLTNPSNVPSKKFTTSTINLQNKRAFPSYTIFGETSVLSMKPIMPKFKATGQDGNIIALSQRGRMMFQFSPSSRSGIQWDEQISFALSAEELGLLVTQLPFHPVTFARHLVSDKGGGMNNGGRYDDIISNDDGVMKTMTVTPIEGAAISFEIDYKKNGVGGQVPPSGTSESNYQSAPMLLTVEAGEWEVLKLVAQESIPSLVGWKKLMDIATDEAITNRSY
jgi:hypothetical protein